MMNFRSAPFRSLKSSINLHQNYTVPKRNTKQGKKGRPLAGPAFHPFNRVGWGGVGSLEIPGCQCSLMFLISSTMSAITRAHSRHFSGWEEPLPFIIALMHPWLINTSSRKAIWFLENDGWSSQRGQPPIFSICAHMSFIPLRLPGPYFQWYPAVSKIHSVFSCQTNCAAHIAISDMHFAETFYFYQFFNRC